MLVTNNRVLLALLCCMLIPSLAEARGRGGGVARGGGGFSGGAANFSRSPSMSRAAPAQQRMAAPQIQNRSPVAARPSSPALNRNNFPGAAENRVGSPGAGINRGVTPGGRVGNAGIGAPGGVRTPPTGNSAFSSRSSFQQPSRSQLDSFLNGAGGSPSTRDAGLSASTLPAGVGSGSKSFETARGGTVTVGGGSRSGTTEGGATVGGAAGGIKIETAGGHTVVRGSGAAGATDGQNSAFAAGSRTGVETAAGGVAAGGRGVRGATDGTNSAIRGGGAVGARDTAGNSAVAARGGYADSSGYRQGGAVTARGNQWGYTAVNARGGYGRNGTGQAGSKTVIRGPGGNVISGGRGASFVNGQFVGGRAYTAVNGNFTRWGYFTPAYYGRYPGAWFPGKWAIVGSAWAAASWATTGTYCGCQGAGTYYDYEQNVTYEDGSVLYEGEPVATAEEYYDQAETIADAGAETKDDQWLPLGVFAIISEDDQSHTDKIIQLALNQDGAIRGNYQDMITDKVTPVTGSVDKATERVALKLEGNEALVVEIGLYNLTNDEVPALVHLNAESQQPVTLIRLKNPEDETAAEQPEQ
ncbi:hypothetical protein [Aureliella helgolandensis]|uniref:Mu-protocadherin-putative cell-suface protein n=1 Tax=Aureliella helgolandensis TaxID=2527968 RepID=A0A518G8N1_9BACT|nr:hypothetical protein [Aureliella helgolandensis]QDV24940.1 hypothetical protein Q31a_32620 [Aureliella helgolandensis]